MKAPDPSQVLVFPSRAELRAWYEEHHATEQEAWIGYYRKGVPKQSVGYLEAVDEGLCFGWVDSVGYRVTPEIYTNRFTPRRKGSNWSKRNVVRVQELLTEGRMHPAGIAAYEARLPERTGVYSYENRPADLPSVYLAQLEANADAWRYWQAASSSYRRAATWWVVSAVQEATRERRLEQLIADSAHGRRIRHLLSTGEERRARDG